MYILDHCKPTGYWLFGFVHCMLNKLSKCCKQNAYWFDNFDQVSLYQHLYNPMGKARKWIGQSVYPQLCTVSASNHFWFHPGKDLIKETQRLLQMYLWKNVAITKNFYLWHKLGQDLPMVSNLDILLCKCICIRYQDRNSLRFWNSYWV